MTKEEIMRNLYRFALQRLVDIDASALTWHGRYSNVTARFSAVDDWTNPESATEEILNALIYEPDNSIAALQRPINGWAKNSRPNLNEYRNLLARIQNAFHATNPNDEFRKCREEFNRIVGRNDKASVFNRMVAALHPGKISPVAVMGDFDEAVEKLEYSGCINIEDVRVRLGDDEWCSKNIYLMQRLSELLPDGPYPFPNTNDRLQLAIDGYSRGIFVWAVYKAPEADWRAMCRHLREQR